MAKPTLTIIIPAYHVADTLERCVKSVTSQDFQSWQTIIVDDGSTDETPQIADELASNDARIITVHKSNGGLSDARNHALDILFGKTTAAGNLPLGITDYVTFIDSDDYLRPGTFTPLMEDLANHPEYDILEYSATLHAGSEREEEMTLPQKFYTAPKDYWLRGQAYRHTYAWNKIYKSSIFSSGHRYAKGKLFEDVWILPGILKSHPNVATTPKGRYIYTDNPKGITHSAAKEASQSAELLHAHCNALSSLGIDLTAPSLSKEEARLYLSLRNQQRSVKLLDPGFPVILPSRHIPFEAATTIRAFIKIFFYNYLGLK